MNLKFENAHVNPIVFGHIGTVANVLAGLISNELATTCYDARDFQYGFELASPKGLQSMGEAVLVNGFCWANSTDHTSKDYNKTIVGHHFVSSGVFLIPKGNRANYKLSQSFMPELSLNGLYDAIYRTMKRPIAIAAFCQFKELHFTKIAKAPIYGEAIFENQAAYYPDKPKVLKNASVFFVSVVANYNDQNQSSEIQSVLTSLQVVLYNNPLDAQKGLNTHTHGLVLNQPMSKISEICPGSVANTVHVFSNESVIESVNAEIFVLGAMKDYQ